MPESTNFIDTSALLSEGLDHHRKGLFAQAQSVYEKVLAHQPDHPDALHLLGILVRQAGDTSRALELLTRAAALAPYNPAFHLNLGIAFANARQFDKALDCFDKAIDLHPQMADAYAARANAMQELQHFEAAIASFDAAIALSPNNADLFYNRGNALKSAQRLEEAVTSYNGALALKSDHFPALVNRGTTLQELGRPEAAVSSYDAAIAINATMAVVFVNRGNALMATQQADAARISFEKAIALEPTLFSAHASRGNALFALAQLEASCRCYEAAIALKPDYAPAYANLGIALTQLEQLDAAVAAFNKALLIAPDFAEAHFGRGNAHKALGLRSAAIADYRHAISANPGYVDAHVNLGVALVDEGLWAEALACYDRAISFRPSCAEAHANRGNVLLLLNRTHEAAASFETALGFKPDYPFIFGTLLHARMHLCDWRDRQHQHTLLREGLEAGKLTSPPFPVLGIFDSNALQGVAARAWVDSQFPSRDVLGPLAKSPRREKIRVAYFSADFHNHATAYLMAEMFERHDKQKFEVFAFSFGPVCNDEMRQRLVKAFDSFIEVGHMTDLEVAKLSRKLGIDVAVDLKGHTQHARFGIFSYRAAPLQVNYLGYPGTLGAEFIDYVIADRVVIPEDARDAYTEKVIYLPNSYQVNDAKRQISDRLFARAELGLPSNGFVFCCFNNSYKITPAMFDIWMRILQAVPDSVLWLLQDRPETVENLRAEACKRGVNGGRLVFADRLPLAEHLARHHCADLFLDTLPYNAHTTASDALWAGLPVLTCVGQSFAGRVAASLLSALDISELVTSSVAAYESLALELAANKSKLEEIKQKLWRNRLSSALFDTVRFTQHIEGAFREIHERHQAGLPPIHLEAISQEK